MGRRLVMKWTSDCRGTLRRLLCGWCLLELRGGGDGAGFGWVEGIRRASSIHQVVPNILPHSDREPEKETYQRPYSFLLSFLKAYSIRNCVEALHIRDYIDPLWNAECAKRAHSRYFRSEKPSFSQSFSGMCTVLQRQECLSI